MPEISPAYAGTETTQTNQANVARPWQPLAYGSDVLSPPVMGVERQEVIVCFPVRCHIDFENRCHHYYLDLVPYQAEQN